MRPDVLLRLVEGEKSFGDRVLFKKVNFWLEPRERAVLLGPNGAGKSTLFQALAGKVPLEGGQLQRPKGVSLVYLPQDYRPQGGSLYQTAYQITPLFRAEQRLEVSDPTHAGEHWNRVRELSFWKGRVAKTLSDFGLGQEVWNNPVEGLSGGEGVRLGLAMTFLSGADVLLLDEPTTHLDLKMRLKLEEMLLYYPGGIGVISHDRALLSRVATTVYHLEAAALLRVAGGFAVYNAERERIKRTIEKARHEAAKERERLLESAASMRYQASQSVKKARQRDQLIRRAEHIQAPDPLPPERRWSLEIAAEGTPKLVLEAKDISKSYARPILEKATLRIFRGDRIALVGANGAGKTTLLRLLLSREMPDSGERTLGLGVSVAYLDQLYHGLEPQKPLFEQFQIRFGESRAAALLGKVGFRPPHWHDPPQRFSGGERARAGLALLGALRAGLLVMDEPTNHIELELLEALERALTDYPGTILFVSHDRVLVKKVATRFWGIEDGALVEYPSYAEAEAAMLGKPAVRLNPYGELPPEEVQPTISLDLEEQRMALLEQLGLAELSERGRVRLKADLLFLEGQLQQSYAHRFYRPHPYRHRVVYKGLEVFSDTEAGHWQFWSRSDFLEAEQNGNLFELRGQAKQRFLQGVLQTLFELEGAQVIQLGKQTWGRIGYFKQRLDLDKNPQDLRPELSKHQSKRFRPRAPTAP